MTCGIYKLTFPNGKFYIGKSINIEKRWEQHANDMRSGKHTKKLQNEFNIWDTYIQEVIFECHPDHIDIMEESLIARQQPELNGTYPKDRLDCIADAELDIFLSYLNKGTMIHIEQLHNTKNRVVELEASAEEQERLVTELKLKRTEEDIAYDVAGKIENLEEEVSMLNDTVTNLELAEKRLRESNATLQAYKNLPWYKKIFS